MVTLTERLASLSPRQRAALELRLKQRRTVRPEERITPRPEATSAPLSFAQQRLWFLDQLAPGSAVYNIPAGVRIEGQLDLPVLARSLAEIVRRQDVLRTILVSVDGTPMQVVKTEGRLSLPAVDLTSLGDGAEAEAGRLAMAEADRPFDLACGPLFRPLLLRLDDRIHVLLVIVHHVVSDGWSMGILVEELALLYHAFLTGRRSPLPELSVRYTDFAVWQRKWLVGEVLERELSYWRQRLQGMPPRLELPTDRPRLAAQTFRGGHLPVALAADRVAGLRALALAEGATLSMVVLAAWQLLLARYAGQEDVSVGMPIAGRNRLEVERLIGCFANTLVLRTTLAGDPSFRQLLGRVRDAALAAYAHQELPFEKLVEELTPERTLAHSPLFQVLFVFHNELRRSFDLPGLILSPVEVTGSKAKFDLNLSLQEVGGGLAGTLEYASDLFDATTAARALLSLETLLTDSAAAPYEPLSRLSLLTEAQCFQALVEWNGMDRELGRPRHLYALFEEQGRLTPEAPALSWEGETLTYQELRGRACRLALLLRSRGVGIDVLVGLCVERSPALVVGILGVLAAGGAWVPLDPDLPRERLILLLADTGVPVVVAQERLASALPETGAQIVTLDDGGAPTRVAAATLDEEVGWEAFGPVYPEQLAYVIHTSGSTGRPKGVMVSHGAIVNRILWMQETFPLSSQDAVLQKTPLTFDASIWELFVPLVTGARLVLARPGGHLSFSYMARAVAEQGVTVLQLVPSLLSLFLEEAETSEVGSLRRVFCGGEVLTVGLRDRLFGLLEVELCNLYGPTECAIDATYWRCDRGDPAAVVPIGRPLSNVRVYVLDADGYAVTPGAVGELHVGGAGLARGYLGQAEMTAEKFVPDAWSGGWGSRLYRTGDLVRQRADGALEYLGRLDQQVKVRGVRIEPGEIESLLAQVPGVREAAVKVQSEGGRQRLVAYVAGGEGAGPDLRRYLEARLPPAMVPSAFVAVEALPRTASGKVDRRALADLTLEPAGEPAVVGPPRTPPEELLAEIWAEVLGLDMRRVGVHDNFFELGGDSILSIQVVARAAREGCRITPRQLFEHQTITELAHVAVLTAGSAGMAACTPQEPVSGPVALTPIQRWFLEQRRADPHHYNHAVLLEILAPLPAGVAERALQALLLHHDALRLRIEERGGAWRQWNAPPDGKAPLLRVDLSALAPPRHREALERCAGETQASLDLTAGPLLRAVWFDLGGDGERLLLVIHHLVVDGVSWRVLLEDLETACRQLAGGEAAVLPVKTTSFQSWAEHLQEHARSMPVEPELSWWLAEMQGAVGLLVADPGDGDQGSAAGTEGSSRTVTIWLSADETRALLQGVPAAYRTRINDALLTALTQALAGPDGTLLVELEGHGREEILDGVDLSRTVGWFTSLFPVRLTVQPAEEPGRALRRVKEHLRAIPGRGVNYGLLRWLRGGEEVERLESLPAPQVSFNYLGQLDHVFPAVPLFGPAAEPIGPPRSPRGERSHRLEVSGQVTGGRLRMDWTYSADLFRRPTVERWAGEFLTHLRALIGHCLAAAEQGTGRATLSDFPFARLDQETCDRLLDTEPDVEDLYPLSPLQEGLLFQSLLAPGSGDYVEQSSCVLHGELDSAAVEEAWRRVVERHPVLRTSFRWRDLDVPLQVVHRRVDVVLDRADWRDLDPQLQEARLETLLRADRAAGFDPALAPLMRWRLIRTAEREHRFVWSHHHLLLDGWSHAAVFAESLIAYQELTMGREPRVPRRRPYRDYIAWLQEGRGLAEAEDYWRRVLAGHRAPTPLGVDHGTAAPEAERPVRSTELSPELSAVLRAFARRHQLTFNTLVQGAWALLLRRYSGEADIVFGTVVSGRSAPLPGIDEILGLFINALPARVRVPDAARLSPWLRELQESQAEMRQFEHSPLAEIQGWTSAGGRALFENLLAFENYPLDETVPESVAGVRLSGTRSWGQTHYPLTVEAIPHHAVLELRIACDPGRFDPATVERMLRHLKTLLQGFPGRSDRSLGDLPLLTEPEAAQLRWEWNDAADPHPPACLHRLFAAQAARTPDAPAVTFGARELSYRDLDRWANRLGHRLRSLGIRPELPVAVRMERSPELVVALLGVLKAGGAYLPIDSREPAERLAHTLRDAGVTVVLTQERWRPFFSSSGPTILCLDGEGGDLASERDESWDDGALPEHLAYMIYTSGSTGLPKGVMVTHRGLVNYLGWCLRSYPVAEGGGAPVHSSIAFDLTVTAMFAPLLAGKTVVLLPEEPGIKALADLLISPNDLSFVKLTPAHLEVLAPRLASGVAAGVRALIVGGEALSAESLAFWRVHAPATRLINEYGPTEAVVGCCVYEVTTDDPASGPVPIGRPLDGARLHLLDSDLRPVPLEVTGELYIGGAGLARGYLSRPDLTAERFMPDPWGAQPGARLYRTGDLARRRPDGNLLYLGRTDDQVKIRGYRVELGEIEAVLRGHPALCEVMVLAREDEPGERRLVAYTVADGAAPPITELRHFAAGKLPEPMVPSVFMALDALPLTANGKVDRRALPAPDSSRPELEKPFVAPRNPGEQELARIWGEVLGLDRVGIHDDFFTLGGHSLTAMRVVSRVWQRLGLQISVQDLFAHPVLESLAGRLEEVRRGPAGVAAAAEPIQRRQEDGPAPLSFAQQRLWFLDRLSGGGPAYNVTFAVRLEGDLDWGALVRSLGEIVRRHEVLRARFVLRDGEPVQEVSPPAPLLLPLVDLQDLPPVAIGDTARRLARDEARRPFDLAAGALMRPTLLRSGARDHVLLLMLHHIVCDGWSTGNLIGEMTALYQAFAAGRPCPLPELPIQYADFAVWQRERLRGEVLDAELSFWRERLAGAPALLELPTDRPRPAAQGFHGAVRQFSLGSALVERLRLRSREHGATLFMTLLTAFQVLLSRFSGQTDVVVGSPVANRAHPEVESLIGVFINTLPFRLDLAGNPPFRELLAAAAGEILRTFDYQDLPFEKLVDELELERNLSHSPVFQVMFVLQNAPGEAPIRLGEHLRLTPWATDSGAAKLDLTLTLFEDDEQLAGAIEHSTELFDATTIERWLGHLGRLLEGIAADSATRILSLQLLSEAEQHQLSAEWNDSARLATGDLCLHEWIEAQVARTPGAVAVVCMGEALTYQELDQRASQVARRLRALGVGPDVPVPICVQRSLAMIVGLLGILKAGGAYVPLDPTYPRERLATVLADACTGAAARVLVVQEEWEPLFHGSLPEVNRIVLRAGLQMPEPGEAADSQSGAMPDNLAYVIYTSGSTGRPKGAMNSHRAICNRLLWMQETYRLTPADRVLQKTPYGFDVSVWELFWPLMTGARLVMARPEGHRDSEYLVELIEQEGITTLHFVPSMLQVFLEASGLERCRSLRRVISSGEALPGELVRRFSIRLGAGLHNLYGPTEAAVDVTFHACRAGMERGLVPIGRPIANVGIHLLDAVFQPVPIGIPGELCIGGVAPARGYLGAPGLTAEKFVPRAGGGLPGERLYRTGDLARFLPGGEVEYLGRIDHQVKIRGFRIELGEIESALAEHPAVREAVVLVRDAEGRGPRLVAYLVGSGALPLKLEEMRLFLQQKLPEHMVPAVFMTLPALPLTPNGKLDRRALPEPAAARPELAAEYVAPRTPAEEILCGIWARILSLGEVGVHDNFFTLGGDSILSLRVVALAAERGLELSLPDLFRQPTVAALAELATGRRDAAVGGGRIPTFPFGLISEVDRGRLPEDVEDAYPLAQLQEGMLYHMALTPDEPLYHNVDSWYLRGRFEPEPFREAVRRVVARHPILRTSFDLEGGTEPLQRVHRQAVLPVEVEDLRHLSTADQDRAVDALVDCEKRRLFDLSRPPQLRLHVFLRSAETFQLTVTENHAISDGWSLHATLAEIFEIYLAALAGEPLPELSPLGLTYRDFVHLERRALASPEAEAFWDAILRDRPASELPRWPTAARPVAGPRVRTLSATVPGEVLAGLRGLARRAAVPLKSVLLAAHLEVLGLLGGQDDVVTGIVSNGRLEEAGGDQVRGLFLNTLPLRLRLAAETWEDLVRQTFAAEQALLPHRRYPFAVLQRKWGESARLEVAFNYIHFHVVRHLVSSGSVEILNGRGAEGASFRLFTHFVLSPEGSQLALHLEHDSRSFSAAQAEAVAGYYLRTLATLAAGLEARHSGLSFLPPAERHQRLLEWNDSGGPAALTAHCIDELVEAQVARTPDAVAVISGAERLSYAELDRRANALACHLRSLGVGPETAVGLCADRSPLMIVGLLGILKAGGVVLPLDPAYPPQRLAYMLDDARAAVLVTQERWRRAAVPAERPRIVLLDGLKPLHGGSRPPRSVLPGNLAYLIYTSGSTGRPKGVAIEHRSAAAFLHWTREAFSDEELSGVLASTSICFDLSIFELLAPLAWGGRVILAANALELLELPAQAEVRLLNTVPSILAELLRGGSLPASVRTVNVAGEPLPGDLVSRTFQESGVSRVLNLYGPSEDTTYSTWAPQPRTAERPPSIGRPLAGKRLYLLDCHLRPLPIGGLGEIWLGGHGLARGYLGRPDLTAERFMPDPFAEEPGQRLYRTGDLGRYLPTGDVEFQGRIDHQVKLRGFRIELGEIEAVLGMHPAVGRALVTRQDQPGPACLVAYVVPREEAGVDPEDLRHHLRAHLPGHMVPAFIVALPVMPLLPNGKADRGALPRPQPVARQQYATPLDTLEEALVEIWQELLQVEQVGTRDNFFDLGGHSLLLLQLRRRIRERFQRDLSMLDMFNFTTVSSMAEHLREAMAEHPPAVRSEARDQEVRHGKDRLKQRLRQRKG